MEIKIKARGALVGMALGEALGAPFEGLTREQIEERVERVEGFVHPAKLQPPHRWHLFIPGAYEDETQVALAVAEVLARKKAFHVESLEERLAELGQPLEGRPTGCYRRPRRNLRLAVRRMLRGCPWREAGVVTAGSTAASRGIPLGVFFRNDSEARLRAAVEATLLTHRDVRAAAATAAVAEAVALAIAADPTTFEPDAALREILAAAVRAEDLVVSEYGQVVGDPVPEAVKHQFSTALARLPSLLDLDLDDALQQILEHARELGSRPITAATRGFALTGVVTALYFVFTGLDEPFEETLLDTVIEGGSSDTLGCLVGGIFGALVGIDAMPPGWLRMLANVDAIAERADALLGLEGAPGFPPLVVMESQLMLPPRGPGRRRGGRGGRPPAHGRPGGPPRGGHRGGPSRGGPPRGGPRRGPPGGRPGGRPGGGGRGFVRPGGPTRGPGGPGRGPGRPFPPRDGGPPRGGPPGRYGGPPVRRPPYPPDRRGPPRDGPPRPRDPRDGPPPRPLRPEE